MVNPRKMCRNHLLGEHKELHQLIGSLNKNISVKGHVEKGQIEIHSIKKRHNELVTEMQKRGYSHNSPLPKFKDYKMGKINISANEKELIKRCINCKKIIDKRGNNMEIPNLKEILKPRWAHRVGYSFKGEKKVELKIFEQGTTPRDNNLLKKLGIKKRDKVLAIAAYYASWAKELQKAGAKVDYSDISRSIANWVKKNIKPKFRKYVVSNYELIPKKPNEYDWTFTYEACGGGRGLPIAYLRSLLNKKGGILMMCIELKHKKANASKVKRYPSIVKTLSRIYNTSYSVNEKKIKVHKREEDVKVRNFLICKIFTNRLARKRVEFDLKFLGEIKNKKKIKLKNKEEENSLKRLNKITKMLVKEDFIKNIEIR